jgi:ribonuclease HII
MAATVPPPTADPSTTGRSARGRRVPGRPPGVRFERPHWEAGRVVAGVDEVGRGSWAGPVTFGAVILEPDRKVQGLRDSKVLRPEVRQRIAAKVHRVALGVGLGSASNDEIDELGMSAAMRLAARRAVEALPIAPEALLIDGNWDLLADLDTDNRTIVKGDARSASIAAASIVAKVARDAQLVAADPEHPAYDFASNKGYPSPTHVAALRREGPCVLHRHSWAPIAGLRQGQLFDLETWDDRSDEVQSLAG